MVNLAELNKVYEPNAAGTAVIAITSHQPLAATWKTSYSKHNECLLTIKIKQRKANTYCLRTSNHENPLICALYNVLAASHQTSCCWLSVLPSSMFSLVSLERGLNKPKLPLTGHSTRKHTSTLCYKHTDKHVRKKYKTNNFTVIAAALES